MLAVVVFAAGTAACEPKQGPKARCVSATARFLDEHRAQYASTIGRARAWLDALDVDPVELRRHGVKGKKKLTELFDAYRRLHSIADAPDRPVLMQRMRDVVAVTYHAGFHDMGTIDDSEFNQDSTSYMRLAVLMDRAGLDTGYYREQIAKIQPRLDAHLRERGVHQRLAFHWYYAYLGLEEPFPLGDALRGGLIARHADPMKMSREDIYDLAHEVFVPFEFGDRIDVEPFDASDKEYLLEALEYLVSLSIRRRDIDVLAELVSCMRYLKLTTSSGYRDGLVFLFSNQNDDGSWGDLARAEQHFGEYARHAVILHTTMVTIEALASAFRPPWNPPERC